MNKLLSFFFKRNIEPKASQSKSCFAEGWDAYQQAKKILFIKDIKERNDEHALFLFDKAIECGIIHAYADRAFCLQGLGFHHDAVNDFDEAISYVNDDANLYFGRGHSKKIIADYSEAISDLKKAVELSKIQNKLNAEYDDEISKSGWSSVAQYYNSQLQDAIYRKKSCQNENLKTLYTQMAAEVKRRYNST